MSNSIVLTRIDDRLIHGQVMTSWLNYTSATKIMVVDDRSAQDPFLKTVLKNAVPKNVGLGVFTAEKAANRLIKGFPESDRVIILVKYPATICKMMKLGVKFDKVNIGGMGAAKNREKFYNKSKKCLYDVLEDGKVRPNQLFALSLSYPVLDVNSKEAKEMFETVTKKLLNKYGLKTLAKGEENYIDIYEGNGFKRDFSYHQGITWTWLLGLYYNCLKRFATESRTGKKKYNEQLEEFIQSVTETFSKEINERGCIGSIAEIYDSKRPFEPKGAVAQAWSVAEVFRIITRS